MHSDAAPATLALLDKLLDCYPCDFGVRLWNGMQRGPDAGRPERFTLVLRHPGALRALFWPPSRLSMAEAYIYDDVDIEGDLHAVFPLGDYLLSARRSAAERLRLGRALLSLPSERRPRGGRGRARIGGRRFSLERDRHAVTYHYDLSNDFFSVYLDRRMVYTCAYFGSEVDDLDTAQEQKLDYLCRKLRLRPGERVLDIGCGWGGLCMFAAEHYGVEVLGITISRPQMELANERIRAAALADRCRVELLDYRELEAPEAFDKVVSVCMFEAVAEKLLPDFFARVQSFLRPGGVFVNQGLGRRYHEAAASTNGRSFMGRYVFPDGSIVPISTALRAAESAGLEVRDVEALREHYVLTLRQWVARLEAEHDAAVRATDETQYRIWRLYMAASAHAMASGRLNLYQMLLLKPDHGESGLPLIRADWYTERRPTAPPPVSTVRA
jgi:cyclopropane-fatty-acyl-phospholipid synthase